MLKETKNRGFLCGVLWLIKAMFTSPHLQPFHLSLKRWYQI